MKKTRIGILGCASIAKRSVIPAIQNLPEHFELAAIASRSQDKAEELADVFGTEAIVGYDNLLDRSDIDAVYMPLPTGIHHQWITKALQAGKHVLAEKSLAMDYSSAMELVEMARSGKLLLMENFMFRHHAQHEVVWNILAEKRLGDIRLFRSQFGFPPLTKDNFRYDKNIGGGALLDAGAYTARASQWFLGPDLEVATATLYFDSDRGSDIHGNATLINPQGLVAQISYGFDNSYQCNYEIWGSKGYLVAKKAFTPKPDEKPVMVLEQNGASTMLETRADNHFVNILKAFATGVATGDHETHLKDILDQSRILDQIRTRSIKHKYESSSTWM